MAEPAAQRAFDDPTPQDCGRWVSPERTDYYFQRRIGGGKYAAVFVGCQGHATLLGVTRQLTGCRWAGATGFQYVGSVGPLDLGTSLVAQLRCAGQCLAAEFGLRGVFGVDVIVQRNRLWVIEVNPRFTASVEVIERATGIVAMALHRHACESRVAFDATPTPAGRANGPVHGKAIVYARQAGTITHEFCRRVDAQCRQPVPRFGDLPHAGTVIGRGRPVLTCFAHGSEYRAVMHQLRAQSSSVDCYLAGRS